MWLQRDHGLYIVNMFDTGQVGSLSWFCFCGMVVLGSGCVVVVVVVSALCNRVMMAQHTSILSSLAAFTAHQVCQEYLLSSCLLKCNGCHDT
jgi:hypothetical protein